MKRMIKCECGYVASGDTDDEVVKKVEEHLKTDHPKLAASTRREDIAGWIEIVS